MNNEFASPKTSRSDFLVIAHRGAKGYAPENTLKAISLALELGAKWIEIDVHLISRALIVTHDTTVTTASGKRVSLLNKNLNFIKSLDMGQGQRIATLQEILYLINDRASLNIELKGAFSAAPVCRTLKMFTHKTGYPLSSYLLSSFRYEELKTAKRLLPSVPLAVLVGKESKDYIATASELRAKFLNVEKSLVDRNLVRLARISGLKILVYTVNRAIEARKLYRMGISGIFTDFVDKCSHLSKIKN